MAEGVMSAGIPLSGGMFRRRVVLAVEAVIVAVRAVPPVRENRPYYPPRREDSFEEAAMSREMFRL